MFENYSVLMSIYIKEDPNFLRKSIDSIVNQTIQTNDFVIVEDGPLTDELYEVLEEYKIEYSFIRLIKLQENHGLGFALNIGLKECKNELVARMDSDDISLPTRCEKELCAFNENDNLDIVGTSIMEFSDNEDNIFSLKTMPEDDKTIRKYARRRNPFNHPTVMYKKSTVFKFGGYPEGKRGEDFDLFTKMVFNGCQCKNINGNYFKYRANYNQFKRRASLPDIKAIKQVAKRNLKNKYISLADYFFLMIYQLIGFLIPKRLGSFLFRKLFRKKPSR